MSLANSHKNNLLTAAILLAALSALALVWWFFLRTPPPPTLPPPPVKEAVVEVAEEALLPSAPLAPTGVQVLEIKGKAEVRRAAQRHWAPLQIGDTLQTEDSVRSLPKSTVMLGAAKHRLELAAGTDLSVKALTAELSSFLVGRGMLQAESDGERTLQIQAEGSDVVVTAKDARLEMSSNGRGTVATASLRGSVEVRAQGKSVILEKDTETLVRPHQAPTKAKPIQTALLLHVRWPSKARTRSKELQLSGQTTPGARVFLGDKPVEVDAQGRFRLKQTLHEGANKLRLHGMGMGGVKAEAISPEIILDTHGAKADFNTKGLWDE